MALLSTRRIYVLNSQHLQNSDEFLAQANPDAVQWESFLLTLHEVFYQSPFIVSDVEKKLQEKTYNPEMRLTEPSTNASRLRDSLPDWIAEVVDRPGFLKQRLGKSFTQRRGTWLENQGPTLPTPAQYTKHSNGKRFRCEVLPL